MKMFEFKFQNNKSSKYLGYGLLGLFAPLILALLLLEIFQWESSFMVLFIVSLLLGFGSLIYGIWKFHTLAKSSDRITLKSDGFDSEFHGYILFSEIESISGFGLMGAPPPSMKIRLRSGKKLVWYLSPTKTSFNKEEDAEIFKKFTVALGDRLAAYERKYSPNTSYTLDSTSEKPPTDKDLVLTGDTLPRPISYEDKGKLSEQVREVTKKHNRAVWAVPVGLVFAVLAFTRTCGEDYFENKREKEMRQIFINSDIRYDQLIEESKEILDTYVPSLGAVYLYSNDKDVDVKLMPDIPENTLLNATPVLARADQSKYLKKLINNPDSTDFLTVLLSPNDDLQFMSKSNLNYLDTAQSWLYLRFSDHALDQTEALNPDSISFKPFYFNTGIPITSELSIEESLKNSVPGIRMMLAQVKHRKSMKMYLTGAEKDGVSEALFHKVKQELQLLLNDVGVDTARFQTQVFDQTRND